MKGDLLLEMRRAVQNRNVFSWPAAVREHNELPTEKSHTLSRQRECLLLAGCRRWQVTPRSRRFRTPGVLMNWSPVDGLD